MAQLGSLVVSLAMDTARFQSDIGKSQRQFQKLALDATKMGAAVGAAAAAAATGLGAIVNAAARANVETGRAAGVAGVSAEQFSRLAVGARAFGIEQDKLADVFKDTQDKVGDFLQNGAGPLADFFDNIGPKVGVTADDFRDLSGPDALQLYVSSLEKANLSQSEMVFYMEAIASDSAMLLPLLRQNGDGFRRWGEEADRLGVTLNQDVLNGSQRLQDNMLRLELIQDGLVAQITNALLPAVGSLADDLGKAASGLVGVEAASSDLRSNNGIQEFAEAGAMSLAVLAEVAVAGARAVRAIGGSFQAVLADLDVATSLLGASPQELREAFVDGTGPLAEALAERRQVVAEANQRYVDLWTYDGTAISDAVRRAFSEEQRIIDSVQNDPRELARRGRGPATRAGGPPPPPPPPKTTTRPGGKSLAEIAWEDARAAFDIEIEWARKGADMRLQIISDLTGRAAAGQEDLQREIIDNAFFDGEITFAEMDTALDKLYGLRSAAGDAKKEVNDFGQQLGLTFSSAFEDAIVEGKNFREVLKSIAADLTRLLLRKNVTEPLAAAVGSFDFSSFFTGGGKVAGGGVTPGLGYLVGESGPEPFVPNQAGRILSNNSMRGAAAPQVQLVVEVVNNTGTPAQPRVEQTSGGGFRVILDAVRNQLAGEIANGQGLMLPIAARLGANSGAALRRRTNGG
jgi:hypothetical protein